MKHRILAVAFTFLSLLVRVAHAEDVPPAASGSGARAVSAPPADPEPRSCASKAELAGGATLMVLGLAASSFGTAFLAGSCQKNSLCFADTPQIREVGALFLVPGLLAVGGGVALMVIAQRPVPKKASVSFTPIIEPRQSRYGGGLRVAF
jgi:hypothetical protein